MGRNGRGGNDAGSAPDRIGMKEQTVTETMTHSTTQSVTETTDPVVAGVSLWQPDAWKQAWAWWQRLLSITRRAPRRLRLCESLPLGERRFVAVVEFEEFRFLVGGTPSSLVLLARLDREEGRFSESLRPMPLAKQEMP